MFREMRRSKQALSREEIIDLLENVARLLLSVLYDEAVGAVYMSEAVGSGFDKLALKTEFVLIKVKVTRNLRKILLILCCGGSGAIKNFVKSHYLPDLQVFSEKEAWVYFSPSTRKVVIDSYHPTFPKSWKNIEKFYGYMMADLKNFLTAHSEYIRRN